MPPFEKKLSRFGRVAAALVRCTTVELASAQLSRFHQSPALEAKIPEFATYLS